MSAALAFLAAAFGVCGLAALVPPRPPVGDRRGARLLRFLAGAGSALRRATGAKAPLSLEQRISAAGSPPGLGPRELIAAKLASALGGAGFGTFLGAVAPGRLGPVVVVAAPAAALLVPDWWLRPVAANVCHPPPTADARLEPPVGHTSETAPAVCSRRGCRRPARHRYSTNRDGNTGTG